MRIEKCECLEVSTSLQLSSSNETSRKFDPTSSAMEDNRWNWLKDCNNWKHHCRTRWKKIARGTLAADLKKKTMSFKFSSEIQKEGTFNRNSQVNNQSSK